MDIRIPAIIDVDARGKVFNLDRVRLLIRKQGSISADHHEYEENIEFFKHISKTASLEGPAESLLRH